jgi:plasmid maintenance system antidote protein VapI
MKKPRTQTMTALLRRALLDCDSLNAVEKATGVKRQSLAKFMRDEQSLRLDMADKVSAHFGIVSTRKDK